MNRPVARSGFACLLAVLLVFMFATFAFADTGDDFFEGERITGKVVQVEVGDSVEGSFGPMENQIVTIEIIDKPYQGQTITVSNMITGQPYYDIVVAKGDRVVVQINDTPDGPEYFLADFSRSSPLALVTGLFVFSLIVIGGLKGLKAFLSLAVAGLIVVFVLLPLILEGYNPLLVTVGVTSIVTVICLLFVGGINRKTLGAILGTIGGLLASGMIAYWIGRMAYLTGLSSSEAQMLQFFENQMDVQGLLFSGIIVGALGAILDVGMSVSSAMEQIKQTDPTISLQILVKRGLNVGRDMLGTMANTLILAYVGSSLPLLLMFQLYDAPWAAIINLDLVATEIVRAMAGTTGLALAIPLTAVVSGLLYDQVGNGISDSVGELHKRET